MLWGLAVGWFILLPVGVIWKFAYQATTAEKLAVDLEHVSKQILLVERLSDLASAEDAAQWRRAENEWYQLVDQLRKDPWFETYLVEKNGDRLTTAMMSGKDAISSNPPKEPSKLHRTVYGIARELGELIQALPEQSRPDSVFELTRKRWYSEAINVTQRMIKANTVYEDIPTSRREFWGLYWGKMSMIENPPVAEAMVDFVKRLREWKIVGGVAQGALSDDLIKYATNLKEACEAELTPPTERPK